MFVLAAAYYLVLHPPDNCARLDALGVNTRLKGSFGSGKNLFLFKILRIYYFTKEGDYT